MLLKERGVLCEEAVSVFSFYRFYVWFCDLWQVAEKVSGPTYWTRLTFCLDMM